MQNKFEERLVNFSKGLIKFLKQVPQDNINGPIIKQLVRSGTSIGANYHEANQASSKSDFKNKIFICKKETNETLYWLKILSTSSEGYDKQCDFFSKEVEEYLLIFSKIISTMKKNGY
jgi:four helix bundle protein